MAAYTNLYGLPDDWTEIGRSGVMIRTIDATENHFRRLVFFGHPDVHKLRYIVSNAPDALINYLRGISDYPTDNISREIITVINKQFPEMNLPEMDDLLNADAGADAFTYGRGISKMKHPHLRNIVYYKDTNNYDVEVVGNGISETIQHIPEDVLQSVLANKNSFNINDLKNILTNKIISGAGLRKQLYKYDQKIDELRQRQREIDLEPTRPDIDDAYAEYAAIDHAIIRILADPERLRILEVLQERNKLDNKGEMSTESEDDSYDD